jgi:hypothetical protein
MYGTYKILEVDCDSGLLDIKNLIIVGDLNFVSDPEEVWGGTSRQATFDDFYKDLFGDKKLIDVKPTKLVPTWRNGRTGVEAVARRLDRCIVAEDLLLEVGVYRSWVEYPIHLRSCTYSPTVGSLSESKSHSFQI